jgi:hypothetical protein
VDGAGAGGDAVAAMVDRPRLGGTEPDRGRRQADEETGKGHRPMKNLASPRHH